jgi:hypothetical protein
MTVDETVIISQSEEIKFLLQKTLIIFGEKQKDAHHQHRVQKPSCVNKARSEVPVRKAGN